MPTFNLLDLESITVSTPNQTRQNELDDRIHPLIPSWIHWWLIASLILGFVTIHTSWRLYQKIWQQPKRQQSSNWLFYAFVYLLHAFTFMLLYLPLLGFMSPIYLLFKWTYWLIRILLIKPMLWLLHFVMGKA